MAEDTLKIPDILVATGPSEDAMGRNAQMDERWNGGDPQSQAGKSQRSKWAGYVRQGNRDREPRLFNSQVAPTVDSFVKRGVESGELKGIISPASRGMALYIADRFLGPLPKGSQLTQEDQDKLSVAVVTTPEYTKKWTVKTGELSADTYAQVVELADAAGTHIAVDIPNARYVQNISARNRTMLQGPDGATVGLWIVGSDRMDYHEKTRFTQDYAYLAIEAEREGVDIYFQDVSKDRRNQIVFMSGDKDDPNPIRVYEADENGQYQRVAPEAEQERIAGFAPAKNFVENRGKFVDPPEVVDEAQVQRAEQLKAQAATKQNPFANMHVVQADAPAPKAAAPANASPIKQNAAPLISNEEPDRESALADLSTAAAAVEVSEEEEVEASADLKDECPF